MSNFKGDKRGFRGNKNKSQSHKRNMENIDDSNPIINAFRAYAQELDGKHDRYERIVKHSRDITIESKRIIFFLHTIDSKKNNSEKVLSDAHKRLQTLCDVNFLSIAKELKDLDPYQYARAYSPGLQEFIEAYTFYEFLNNSNLSSWEEIQMKLDYEALLDNEEKSSENCDGNEPSQSGTETAPEEKTKISCFVQPIEFMLGLADLTGEVMRRCINSLGSGDIDTCFTSCRMLQSLYTGYVSINSLRSRDLSHKIYTMEQSVLKTEDVCYNVKIRGGEAAKWGTVESFGKINYEEDEGFY